MRRLFANPLGACAPPQAPNQKNIAPAVLAGIIAGGATLVGGAANLVSQANANNANRDIASETNATNMQINREQLAAQRAMYYTQARENRALIDQAYERELENRSYNSPQNQKELYLRAGINPLLAGQFGSVGASHSMQVPTGQVPSTSTPNAIPAQAGAPVQPLNFDGLGLAAQNAANVFLQSKADDRADYALANDIEVSRLNAQSNFMNSITKAKEAGVNELYIRSAIEDAERNYWLKVDQNDQQKEFNRLTHDLDERRVDIEERKVQIEGFLASSKIQVDKATVQKLASDAAVNAQTVKEMKANGVSERKIKDFIAKKEKETFEMLKRQNAREGRNDIPGIRQSYQDFTEWLFAPLKGLVSVGIK